MEMTPRTIFKALSAVQMELAQKGIAKTDENTYDNYKFRGIDAVLNTVSPIFAKHGVVLLPSQQSCEIRTITTAKGTTMNHCKVVMDFTFYDGQGDSVTSTFPGEAMDRGDKSVNKACTAAYKYFLFEALCIPVEGTPDADSESHEVGEPLISQSDIDAFVAVMGNGDPFAFVDFFNGYTEEQRNELFNSAPKGQKTKWKDAARRLEREAHATIDEYADNFRAAIESQDELAVSELASEMSETEKRMCWARLTDIEKHQIKQLREGAAA